MCPAQQAPDTVATMEREAAAAPDAAPAREPSDQPSSDFALPCHAGPRDASALASALLEWLGQRGADAVLELGNEEREGPSPTALQLLVAATRSEHGGALRLGPCADAALSGLGTAAPFASSRS
ncbi:MAG: hypothetical protein AAF577_07765 [Pseudomonadota bacterium]